MRIKKEPLWVLRCLMPTFTYISILQLQFQSYLHPLLVCLLGQIETSRTHPYTTPPSSSSSVARPSPPSSVASPPFASTASQ